MVLGRVIRAGRARRTEKGNARVEITQVSQIIGGLVRTRAYVASLALAAAAVATGGLALAFGQGLGPSAPIDQVRTVEAAAPISGDPEPGGNPCPACVEAV